MIWILLFTFVDTGLYDTVGAGRIVQGKQVYFYAALISGYFHLSTYVKFVFFNQDKISAIADAAIICLLLVIIVLVFLLDRYYRKIYLLDKFNNSTLERFSSILFKRLGKMSSHRDRLKILVALSDKLWEDYDNTVISEEEYIRKMNLVKKEINNGFIKPLRNWKYLPMNWGISLCLYLRRVLFMVQKRLSLIKLIYLADIFIAESISFNILFCSEIALLYFFSILLIWLCRNINVLSWVLYWANKLASRSPILSLISLV